MGSIIRVVKEFGCLVIGLETLPAPECLLLLGLE